MPVSNKKALMTMSEPVVICSQPHLKPAKRAKKSKTSSNAEAVCPSFSRSLMHADISKETPTEVDTPQSADESMLCDSEGPKAGVIRKRPSYDETMKHLFGPYTKPTSRPRRRWELDTYYALFGPDGQMMMSEHPRHYDIFELHRDMRIRRKKQHAEDMHGELLGDTTSSSGLTSSMSVTHDRLFGVTQRASASESIEQTPKTVEVSQELQPYFIGTESHYVFAAQLHSPQSLAI